MPNDHDQLANDQCPMTVFVSAGEPSGDAHAAAFIRALKELRPDIVVEGFGGPKMAAEGAELMARMEDFTVIGFVEVLKKVPAHYRLMKRMEQRLRRGGVRLLVLVDYPGFHMRVAAMAKKLGVPVFYYIAPQLWAWHESRVKKMARDVAKLAVILPFEPEFFAERGVPTVYVGHPLLDRPAQPARDVVKRHLGLDPRRPVLGLFPGSRAQEVARLWPLMRDAAKLVLARRPDVQCIVAGTRGASYGEPGPVRVIENRPLECFAAADAALSKSGTTTLEAALAGAPQVIAYRMNGLSYRLAKRLVRVSSIGLANLVAGRRYAPEFIQDAATPAALADAVLPLLDESSPEREAQMDGIAEVRRRLGQPGAARRAAREALSLINDNGVRRET